MALTALPTFQELEAARVADLIERVIRPKPLPTMPWLYGTVRSAARLVDVDLGPMDGWLGFYRSTRSNLK